jgi:nicotinamide-nucleotide amidase
MNAIIVTIGDEILVGQTVDTNSAHIAKELNKLGIAIDEILSISDTEEHIKQALNQYVGRADFVFLTGGLGPTNDDITKHVLTEYFNDKLVIYPEILDKIKNFFERFNKPFLEVNRLQALLPENARIIENTRGTASGMWFKKGKSNIFSMPGVPYEMKGLLDDFLAELVKEYPLGNLYHNTVRVTGIGESYLAEQLKEWEQKILNKNISVSYLPSVGELKIRLTGKLDQKEFIDQNIDYLLTEKRKYVYGREHESIVRVIGDILIERNLTLGTVESCTGGSIAIQIVSMSGSSEFYNGSIVSYTNELKANLVGVKQETLDANGAVSEQVVREMAINGAKILGTDYCISVSGIAGPSGGSDAKPVGTVWIGLTCPEGTYAKKFSFGYNRKRNIQASVYAGLNFLRLSLIEEINL